MRSTKRPRASIYLNLLENIEEFRMIGNDTKSILRIRFTWWNDLSVFTKSTCKSEDERLQKFHPEDSPRWKKKKCRLTIITKIFPTKKKIDFKRQFLEDKKLLPKYDVLYVRHILEMFKYLWLLWYEYVKYTYN